MGRDFALLATASVCLQFQSLFFFTHLLSCPVISPSPHLFIASRVHNPPVPFSPPPPVLPQGDRWGFGEVGAGGTPASHTYNNVVSSAGDERAGQWSNNTMLSHRRCNSAPNISSSWRGASLPSLPSGVLAPDLRDHTIPEGRRFEASTQPTHSSVEKEGGLGWTSGLFKKLMNFLFFWLSYAGRVGVWSPFPARLLFFFFWCRKFRHRPLCLWRHAARYPGKKKKQVCLREERPGWPRVGGGSVGTVCVMHVGFLSLSAPTTICVPFIHQQQVISCTRDVLCFPGAAAWSLALRAAACIILL